MFRMTDIRNSFLEARNVLDAFLAQPGQFEKIDEAIRVLVNCFESGNRVFSCGNGGSMCDAMHFAEELSGRFRHNRRALPAIAISDPSHITCVANDYGYNEVFARFIEAHGKPGDVLLAISTSGNSPNVLRACEVACEKGIAVIALSGKYGGKLAELASIEIRAPFSDFADRAQEIHIKVIHALIEGVEKVLFPVNY
jgi:D-sedoheptulose 7-phosphate isomerase